MFRKQVNIEPSSFKIEYRDQLITLGSCFSNSIGAKLENARFDVSMNPFGTLFHPVALSSLFDGLKENQVVERDHYFFHWQLGGSHFDRSKDQMIANVRSLNKQFQTRLQSTKVVFVTFGTAWGYVHNDSNKIVANCHKMPQSIFQKKLVVAEDILQVWKPIVQKHDAIQWVFTVSPVRHWKDGVRENNVSKGILHQVVDELLKVENVTYFPAYEILLDELRDYRFYASDLLHPSQEAVDYIWKRFRQTYCDQRTDELVTKVEKLEASKKHKLMYPESEESKKFLQNLTKQEEEVENLLSGFRV